MLRLVFINLIQLSNNVIYYAGNNYNFGLSNLYRVEKLNNIRSYQFYYVILLILLVPRELKRLFLKSYF